MLRCRASDVVVGGGGSAGSGGQRGACDLRRVEQRIAGLREFLAELRVSLPVSQLAKWKTAAQMVALTILLLGDAVSEVVHQVGIGLIWAAAVLTLITGYDYLRTGLRHMAEGGPT